MDVGIQTLFASDGWDGITDGQVYDEDLRLALLADELGFDVAWAAEHHFFGYSFCPDNTELLAYLAGAHHARRRRHRGGDHAVERPAAGGRAGRPARPRRRGPAALRHGPGPVPARVRHFRAVEMDESRGRFDEGTAMVLEALRTGLHRGRRALLPPAPHRDPAPARALASRTASTRWPSRRLGRGRRPLDGRDDDVRRPVVETPDPVDHHYREPCTGSCTARSRRRR